jgi:delta 1-pyrroline-5-carboxylate dehydrogenase
MWKFGLAIACGNAFVLKPSERDPGVPLRLAELMIDSGLPPGILNVVNGDKEAVDAILDDPDIAAVGFVGSTPVAQYIYARGAAAGKRVQCFGSAKNHMVVMPDADMDKAVDALIGAGYGSAGERCMSVSVAVPVGEASAKELIKRLIPRVESLKIGPSTDPNADFGPLVTKSHLDKVKAYVDLGIKEGAKLVVDGRDFKMQGYANGFYMGGCLFDEVTSHRSIWLDADGTRVHVIDQTKLPDDHRDNEPSFPTWPRGLDSLIGLGFGLLAAQRRAPRGGPFHDFGNDFFAGSLGHNVKAAGRSPNHCQLDKRLPRRLMPRRASSRQPVAASAI